MHFKAIVFDLDNTLINRKKMLEKFSTQFLDKHFSKASVIERSRMLEVIRIADRDGYVDKRDLFVELSETLSWETKPILDELLTYWYDQFPKCAEPMEGVYQVLDEIKDRQVKLGLITNGLISVQNCKIDQVKIRHYFDVIMVSEEMGINKPDTRIFHTTLQRLEVDPCDAIYVGDHPINDIQGSRNAGMHSVWLQGFMDWVPSINEAEYKINKLEQILELM